MMHRPSGERRALVLVCVRAALGPARGYLARDKLEMFEDRRALLLLLDLDLLLLAALLPTRVGRRGGGLLPWVLAACEGRR